MFYIKTLRIQVRIISDVGTTLIDKTFRVTSEFKSVGQFESGPILFQEGVPSVLLYTLQEFKTFLSQYFTQKVTDAGYEYPAIYEYSSTARQYCLDYDFMRSLEKLHPLCVFEFEVY